MDCRTRSKPPEQRQSDLPARLATFDQLAARGLVSEVVVHVLFAHRGWCLCPRCLFDRTEADR